MSLPASRNLVTSAGDPARVSLAFLVTRPYPVTWADVRRMNDYGLLAQNHQMFLNPPADSELNLQMAQMLGPGQQANNLLLLLAVVGIFIETTLLTTPAVAVSAARQRRSLSLAASNGAETHQLWRYVLGQAVVLGVVSAAVAAVTANT